MRAHNSPLLPLKSATKNWPHQKSASVFGPEQVAALTWPRKGEHSWAWPEQPWAYALIIDQKQGILSGSPVDPARISSRSRILDPVPLAPRVLYSTNAVAGGRATYRAHDHVRTSDTARYQLCCDLFLRIGGSLPMGLDLLLGWINPLLKLSVSCARITPKAFHYFITTSTVSVPISRSRFADSTYHCVHCSVTINGLCIHPSIARPGRTG
jgi:hypothetical protein